MRWSLYIGSILLTACSLRHEPPVLDVLIRNASILDGTGSDPFSGSVGISHDRIVLVSRDPHDPSKADTVIDAAGRTLSPGFIDLHSHGNSKNTSAFENFLAMGVTTICLGQDGSSPATTDLRQWEDSVETQGIGVNIAMFIGHGTLRELSGTSVSPVPDHDMMERMKTILRKNMPEAFGMTTGLEYAPGLYAQAAELDTLAAEVGRAGGMIMSHMRNEDDRVLHQSINELLAQGRYCPVHISHLKSVYGHGAERADEILSWLYEARQQGIRVTADEYPYMASYTGIAILFPDWSKTPEQFELAKRERREQLESFIRHKVALRNGPEATLFGTAPYAGQTLKKVADSLGMPFEKVLIDEIGPQGASAAYFVMNDSLQSALITDPLIAISSDGSPTSFHPRGHGTFARMIEEYVLHRNALSLAEAVRKMTSYPAEILGLSDRGRIREGMKADLVLFYPDSVHENATYENPYLNAEGFDQVFVNGRMVLSGQAVADSAAGIFLHREKRQTHPME